MALRWSVKLVIEVILLICGMPSGWFPKETFSIALLRWCSPVLWLGVWDGCLSTFAQF